MVRPSPRNSPVIFKSRRSTCLGLLTSGAFCFRGGPAFAQCTKEAAIKDTERYTKYAVVPFEIDAGGHIFIEATLLGQTLPAILDSGAAVTAIDLAFARSVGLNTTQASAAEGLTATFAVTRVAVPPITVGNYSTRTREGMVADLSDISSALGREVRLVLGQDWMATASLTLNYRKHFIELSSVDAPIEPGYVSFSLAVDQHAGACLPVTFENGGLVQAKYDLGSNAPLFISPTYALAAGLLNGRQISQSATIGGEGLAIAQIATLKTMSIGPFILRDIPFQVPTHWNQGAPALLGVPIWQRFTNIINFSRKRLALSPDSDEMDLPFAKDRSGLGAQRLADRLKIIFVAPGSPAHDAGLKAGDEIIKIDGVAVGPLLYATRPRPGAEASGTIETLQLASGRVTDIELRDYF